MIPDTATPPEASDDADGDGFASPLSGGDDCDDDDADVFPGADERCNLADDDCDAEVDEGCPVGFTSAAANEGIVWRCSTGPGAPSALWLALALALLGRRR